MHAKLRKPTINCAIVRRRIFIRRNIRRIKILPMIHAAIYYDVDRRKRRWHSCTPRPSLLRYKGHIWRGNKQIDIVKRFYGTRAPMLGPRLQPSLNGASVPRARTHSNWFPDRSWFRGRFKLANRPRLTLRRVCQIVQFFMQSHVKYLRFGVIPIEFEIIRRTVVHSLVIKCIIFGIAPI